MLIFSLIQPVGKYAKFFPPAEFRFDDGLPTVVLCMLCKKGQLAVSGEFRVIVMGNTTITIPLALQDIYGENPMRGANLSWEVNVEELEFTSNQFFTPWISVNDLIIEDKVVYNEGRLVGDGLDELKTKAKDIFSDPNFQACIRFEVTTAPSNDRWWLMVRTLPARKAHLVMNMGGEQNMMSISLGRIDCHTVHTTNANLHENVKHAPFIFIHGGKLKLTEYKEMVDFGTKCIYSFMRIIHDLDVETAKQYVLDYESVDNVNKSRHPYVPTGLTTAQIQQSIGTSKPGGDPMGTKGTKRTADGTSKTIEHHETGTVSIAKYGTSKDIFKFVTTASEQAKPLLCLSYASRTWDSYLTAWRSLSHFLNLKGLKPAIPLTADTLSHYICYLKFERKLEATTIRSYVSALKMLHELNNTSVKSFDNVQIKFMLRGISNLCAAEDNSKFTRNVISFAVLQIFGHELHKDKTLDPLNRQVIWTAALLGYHGSFRMGELLTISPNKFDPIWGLAWDNIKVIGDDHLCVVSKLPKTSEDPRGHVIDLIALNQSKSLCPVYNVYKLMRMNGPLYLDDPVFRLKSGKMLTMKLMNDMLKKYLKPLFPQAVFTCHSFR